ncbi:hypothetical protein PYV61_25680, partial [Roseisolibacter sp. H3M3-2]
YTLVQAVNHAAQLARYDIQNSREFGPIQIPLKLRWMGYKPGDCVTAHLPESRLEHQPILLMNRSLDPGSGVVTMAARSETAAKHAFALGQTTTPPPTPALGSPGTFTNALALVLTAGINIQQTLRNSYVKTGGVALLSASDAGDGSAKVSVAAHEWDYPDPVPNASRSAGQILGLAFNTDYYVFFDDDSLGDVAPTYSVATAYAAALNSSDHPDRHYLGYIKTPAAPGSGGTSGGSGGGYGGGAGGRGALP